MLTLEFVRPLTRTRYSNCRHRFSSLSRKLRLLERKGSSKAERSSAQEGRCNSHRMGVLATDLASPTARFCTETWRAQTSISNSDLLAADGETVPDRQSRLSIHGGEHGRCC